MKLEVHDGFSRKTGGPHEGETLCQVVWFPQLISTDKKLLLNIIQDSINCSKVSLETGEGQEPYLCLKVQQSPPF